MAADVQPFVFQKSGQTVRTILLDGAPWFVAADVTTVLGYRMASDATRWLDEDEKGTHVLRTPGGHQSVTVISEPGLYELALRSKVPGAKAFRRWITHEVIPALRRTGRYEVAQQHELPKSYAEALRELATTVEQRDAARAELAVAAPKAEAYSDLMESDGTYSMGAVANMIGLGRNTMMARLRDAGVLQKDNRPYQRHADHFNVVAQRYEARGESRATYTTYVRPSGLDLIRRTLGRPVQLSVVPA